MSVLEHAREQFTSEAQELGATLFARSAVTIDHVDSRGVDATVRHRGNRFVAIRRKENTLRYSCSCRRTDGPCEHVWAMVMLAERRNLIGDWPADSFRLLLPDEESVFDEEPESAEQAAARAAGNSWKRVIAGVHNQLRTTSDDPAAWPPTRQIAYVIDIATTADAQGISLEVRYRDRKPGGEIGRAKGRKFAVEELSALPDPIDRQIITSLVGAKSPPEAAPTLADTSPDSVPFRYRLQEPWDEVLIPQMCATGRCFVRAAPDADLLPVKWESEPWELWLEAALDKAGTNFILAGSLRRGEMRISIREPLLLVSGGMVFLPDRIAPLKDFGAFAWVYPLRQKEAMSIPIASSSELLRMLLDSPRLPRLDLPEELKFEEVRVVPTPRLRLRAPERDLFGKKIIHGDVSFDYDGKIVAGESGSGLFDAQNRRRIVRDRGIEAGARYRLAELGFRESYESNGAGRIVEIAHKQLPRVVRELTAIGWHVEAEGKLYRQAGKMSMEISSGIDWFELHGSVQFGEMTVPLPKLLAALRRGETVVRLDDGSFGMVPEEWLKRYGLVASLGEEREDHVRFAKTQVGLLDAMLAAEPETRIDLAFAQARDALWNFQGIRSAEAPEGFIGELRAYQKEGLGWMAFLREFGFGGCLADDMGLGKTVQVLAMLEARRQLRESAAAEGKTAPGPSLVVVPRSLVFNWKQEAERFVPKLRVLDHTGVDRTRELPDPATYDLLITTYGTLRRDIPFLRAVHFDYCMLDEAQAVKNAASESAKAARLLKGTHRLVLSGTPIQNHLGELWSLFEFLNPGMLGATTAFSTVTAGSRTADDASRQVLARALRPFILRRTKGQVARDLPEKIEQTIFCELDTEQRQHYDELKAHYRQNLLTRIDAEGLGRSKIQILEALLRLRQVACHPGLVDPARKAGTSAKLETLLLQLSDILEEGHKALVFSQFTSLLAIVRDRLDRMKVPYEYLDGKTRDRQQRVERFQNDEKCRLFLVSLKAGGVGLNLTAAEYVFLLDPWWNPAVEAQAIDRTHRIGQTRGVFAYRLIARDTVEEKILQLQQTKRDLAESIIMADESLIRTLTRDDLAMLLS